MEELREYTYVAAEGITDGIRGPARVYNPETRELAYNLTALDVLCFTGGKFVPWPLPELTRHKPRRRRGKRHRMRMAAIDMPEEV